MNSEIRKNQITLSCSGLAVILFGAWNILRSIMGLILDPDQMSEILGISDALDDTAEIVISVCIVAIFVIVDLLLRTFIGTNAIAVGRGEVRSNAYIILAILLLLLSVSADMYSIIDIIKNENTTHEISSIIIDLSTCIAFYEVIFTSLRLKRIDKDFKTIGIEV